MIRLYVFAAFLLMAFDSFAANQPRILVLGWNLESGENNPDTISQQLAAFEGFDIASLTEAAGSNASKYTKAFASGEAAARQSPKFQYSFETTGAYNRPDHADDQMRIIYNTKNFKLVGEKQEIKHLQFGNYRAPLYAAFRHIDSGDEFIFMINHLARGTGATNSNSPKGLIAWAKSQTPPIIAVGGYNFDYSIDTGKGKPAFDLMLSDEDWIEPEHYVKTSLGPKYNGILDFVFTANKPP